MLPFKGLSAKGSTPTFCLNPWKDGPPFRQKRRKACNAQGYWCPGPFRSLACAFVPEASGGSRRLGRACFRTSRTRTVWNKKNHGRSRHAANLRSGISEPGILQGRLKQLAAEMISNPPTKRSSKSLCVRVFVALVLVVVLVVVVVVVVVVDGDSSSGSSGGSSRGCGSRVSDNQHGRGSNTT